MTVTINGTTGITTPAVTNEGAYTGDGVVFADSTPSNTLVTTTDGRVGIGTSSPQQVIEAVASNSYFRGRSTGGAFTGVDFGQNSAGDGIIYNRDASKNIIFYNNAAERMRIDSSGNLLVNTTTKFGSGFPAQVAVKFDDSTTQGMGFQVTGSVSSADYVVFRNSSSTNIGSITRNGTSNAVLYNTTSDYRLKENVTPLTNALDRVSALKPVQWVWKDCDGAVGEGFIAHEVQAIVPNAVNGAKDAVDEEGNIKPQGMDASYLVATLTAAIQELKAEFDEYKATHP